MSQRFCLRWNNHQSNMLSVFDQLLHDESFVDVTLAVDGHLLKAHKMVLSACSPLFQALFIGHPDKHPIVILKDVPYADMRCLLDFMYRGEVSVDQDRLTAFLKVAESLRIKGLTEVNEEKCDIPSITNNLLSSLPNAQTPPPPPPPPPHLQRLPHGNSSVPKRSVPPLVASNPLLGSALTAPKRKRGRPRKLSGSSNGDPAHTRDSSPHDHDQDDALDFEFDSRLGHGSSGESIHSSPPPPELMEMHMDYGQPSATTKLSKSVNRVDNISRVQEGLKDAKGTSRKKPKEENEPTPGTSSQDVGSQQFRLTSSNSLSNSLSSPSGNGSLHNSSGSGGSSVLNTDSYSSVSGVPLLIPKLEALSRGALDHSMSPPVNNNNNDLNKDKDNGFRTPTTNSNDAADLSSGHLSTPNTQSSGRQPTKRARRRRATSTSQDPAEQLTEMSVRGLNLFRYASVAEGVYKCMECAKVDVNKTFKNKYSFQRHAFLYHEGHQRKVFPCPVCAKEFSRPDKMKNHMKTVHDCFMPKDCVFPVGFYMPP